MSKPSDIPQYGFVPPPQAPPSYAQAINGCNAANPLTPQQPILTQQQIVTTIIPLGPSSSRLVCPSCRSEIITKTKKSPSLMAWISGFIIALAGCFCGCCLVPCAIAECMDVHHSCSNCGAYLGRFRH